MHERIFAFSCLLNPSPIGSGGGFRSGEAGIRTLGTLLGYNALAKRRFRPLSHLTKYGGGKAIAMKPRASNETFIAAFFPKSSPIPVRALRAMLLLRPILAPKPRRC